MSLAEKMVEAIMARLRVDDAMDADEDEERRQALLVVIEKVLYDDQYEQED